MRIVYAKDSTFEDELDRIKNRDKSIDLAITTTVKKILNDVKTRGDEALFEYTEKFDKISLDSYTVEVSQDEMEKAISEVDERDIDILKLSASRIKKFHEKQKTYSWIDTDEDGTELGQLIRPLDKVGIYAPGGLASYPSTVLMAAVPAKVAGVGEIVLVTPSGKGKTSPAVLAAAKLGGVDRVFKIGGAQAIAALAWGTESVPRVDKIVGPGNAYVAEAKRTVFGQVGIDMIAGPSEIVIISDGTVRPEIVAADLLSQAEHDEMASSMLITPDREFASKVASEVESQLKRLSRCVTASKSIEDYGAIIITADMEETVGIANRIAPEHLEIITEDPKKLLEGIKNVGSVFLGDNTPEALGDYMAGPNHILPTGGTARFSSPLGVYDFVKRTSVISFSEKSLKKYGKEVSRFTEMEGFDAHGRSVDIRLEQYKKS